MRAAAVLLAAALAAPALAAPGSATAPTGARPPAKTVAEIIERNAEARGGLEAWRKINTMVWLGHLDRANSPDGQPMRFVMELKRPNATRFEIKSKTQQFARIFDGKRGWKVRPGQQGQPDPVAFTPEEVNFAREEFAIDGPLLDAAAKGVTVKYDGLDNLGGRRAYRLSLTLPSGAARNVWVDTKTNLEFRYDRPSTSPLSPGARVSTYYDDWRAESGVQVAHRIEVAAAKGRPASEVADKLILDRVLVNPVLDEAAFAPPTVPRAHAGRITVPAEPMAPRGAPVAPPR